MNENVNIDGVFGRGCEHFYLKKSNEMGETAMVVKVHLSRFRRR